MTFEEMAWEFAEVSDELDTLQINEMLARNVPIETLKFFSQYVAEFTQGVEIPEELHERLPNLMLIGYLLRSLEQKLDPQHN